MAKGDYTIPHIFTNDFLEDYLLVVNPAYREAYTAEALRNNEDNIIDGEWTEHLSDEVD